MMTPAALRACPSIRISRAAPPSPMVVIPWQGRGRATSNSANGHILQACGPPRDARNSLKCQSEGRLGRGVERKLLWSQADERRA